MKQKQKELEAIGVSIGTGVCVPLFKREVTNDSTMLRMQKNIERKRALQQQRNKPHILQKML